MKNYAKENLTLFNMKKVPLQHFVGNSPEVFEIEKEMSIEEKIEFIDSQKDGVATYLLEIFNKWASEKDTLPQKYNSPKTVSKKAWIKRNDPRKIINTEFKMGSYHLFGKQHMHMVDFCDYSDYGYNMVYTGQHIVNQWFHDLLLQMYFNEKKHFEAHDPFTIKLKMVKYYGEKYGALDSREINDIVWNGKRDFKESNLDVYIELYQELEESVKAIEKKLHNTLDLEKL